MPNILSYVPPGVQYPLKFPIAVAAYDAASVGVFATTAGTPISQVFETTIRRIIVKGGAVGLVNIRFWPSNTVVLPIQIDPAAFPFLPWVIDFGPRGIYFPGGIGVNGIAGSPIVDIIFDIESRNR